MNRMIFYLSYALRSLRRDNTRTFLAGLSVAFGILSLISMQLLANALLHGAMFDQRIQYGGDAVVRPANGELVFSSGDLEQIKVWQQQGLISRYTTTSNGSSRFLRTPSNGRVLFINNAMGIDVTTYPLTGELILREPAGKTAADVLQHPMDALVTRDIADQRNLHTGDTILLSSSNAPIRLNIVGIIGATPNQNGDSVFYSLETARLIENRDEVVNTISLNWGDTPNAEQILIDSPYDVFVAVSRDSMIESSNGLVLFEMMLKGAGVLGLLVGGLSVSNTLQVILARRKLEIAMLKTLGYQQADLLLMIGLETGMIGLAGGTVGAFAGSQLAGKLLDVLSSVGSIMLDWHPDPLIVGGGIVTGVLTAVFFGMQAILASSATRPVQLLRELPLQVSRRTQTGRLVLYFMMLLVFGVLVGVVLGSPAEGILYVIVGGILLVLLRAIFWAVLWGTLKLPLPLAPLLRLARANLRQRKMQASLAVMALFAGAFSVTFAALVIYNAQLVITTVRGSDEGFNLMVYTPAEGTANVVDQMVAHGVQATYITKRVTARLNGAEVVTIEGRDAGDLNKDMRYDGDWSDDKNIVLLPDNMATNHAIGEMFTLNANGQEQVVELIGFYTVDWNTMLLQTTPLIVPRRTVESFDDGSIQTRIFGSFPVHLLNEATTALGLALPQMLVFSRADLKDAGIATYQALFTFAVSIAGLAFVAGAVLIANAAGLNIVERYREIGIFKAVGYTTRHVLYALLSEYGFLGGLAGVFGIAGAVSAITVINIMQFGSRLVIEPSILLGMLVFSVGIAVLSAGLVAWQPSRVRPLDVLRYE